MREHSAFGIQHSALDADRTRATLHANWWLLVGRRGYWRALVAIGAVTCIALVVGCGSPPPAPSAPPAAPAFDSVSVDRAVRALLDEQVAAWNRGDVEAFMAGYWKSDELRFASGGDVTHGWDATLARYHTRYPDRAAMGTLSFEEIDVRALGPDHALAFGRYVLERESDRPTGLFTLLLERRAEGWRIVHDHTSAAEPGG